jgi:hypothetical protein
MMYLLDANVFIQAKNQYYRFDVAPRFWTWLDSQQAEGVIASVMPVYDELLKGDDDLTEWARERKDDGWFLQADDLETQTIFTDIATWVMAQPFKPHAKEDFLDVCDPWLIAKASALGATLVTLETYAPDSKRKVKIPNVCRQFDVDYVNTFDMLSELGARI